MSRLGPFEENTVICGDTIEVMAQLPDACVDAIVTDPPYGLEFMGKSWDSFKGDNLIMNPQGAYERKKGFKQMVRHLSDRAGLLAYQQWTTAWATEAYRILKPGAYMLVMGGTRTHHRLACGIEDAGFLIYDEEIWIYAQGFPKNYDVSKGIDKKAGRINQLTIELKKRLIALVEASGKTKKQIDEECGFRATNYLTLPREGKRPDPWVNTLPPYEKWLVMKQVLGTGNELDKTFREVERVVVGQKEVTRILDGQDYVGGTIKSGMVDIDVPATPKAQYWEGYGTALKPAHEPIWLCKKPNEGTYVDNVLKHGCGAMNIDASRIHADWSERPDSWKRSGHSAKPDAFKIAAPPGDGIRCHPSGRWPANVIVDCYPEEFQGGVVIEGEGKGYDGGAIPKGVKIHAWMGQPNPESYKPQKDSIGNGLLGPYTRFFVIPKPSKAEKTAGGKVENRHVTVKPVRLGKWLVKLIVPHQRPVVVIDPFCGSGAFLRAMQELNFEGYQIDFYGIDKDEESVKTTLALLEEDRAGRQLQLL